MALIKLPFGTVSDIYTPVSFQLAVSSPYQPQYQSSPVIHIGYISNYCHSARWHAVHDGQDDSCGFYAVCVDYDAEPDSV